MSLEQLGNYLFGEPVPERSHEYHQDTVRVALYRMDPQNPETLLMPSDAMIRFVLTEAPDMDTRQLEQILFESMASPVSEATTMTWEVKGNKKDVVNPNQIIMPGGGGKPVDPSHPIGNKSILKTALEESSQEVHLIAHEAVVIPKASYTYSFNHPRLPDTKKPGRLKNTTHLVAAHCAPSDVVRYFDPADKLQNVLSLTPSEVTQVLHNDGYNMSETEFFPLVDSLSINQERRKQAGVMSHDSEIPFKTEIETQAYIYEAFIQREIIIRLSELAHLTKGRTYRHIQSYLHTEAPTSKNAAMVDIEKARKLTLQIEKSYTNQLAAPVRYISPESYQQLVDVGISPERLKKRMKLIDDKKEAMRQISLELTVRYYKETGPQFPLLLSQVMAQIPTWGKYEYTILSQCPELKHIVDIACETFNVNPETDNWHDTLRTRLAVFRATELTNPPEYKQINDRWTLRFCNPTDTSVWTIGDPNKLGLLSSKVNKYLDLTLIPLSKVADQTTLNLLKSDALGSVTSEISELTMLMLGNDQYTGAAIEETSERAAGSRKLVHILHMDRVDRMRMEKVKTHIKPFREAARALLGKPVGTITTAAGVFKRHSIASELAQSVVHDREFNTKYHTVDITSFDIPVIFFIREKDEFSLYRKFIERGGIESAEEDLSDSFGFMGALDEGTWKKTVQQRYPTMNNDEVSRLAEHWSLWATSVVLSGFNQYVLRNREALHPKVRLYKGRVSPEFEGILPIEEQGHGSASSHATWKWVKFLEEMTDDTRNTYQVEWQFFPSVRSMVAKKEDDTLFDIMRLFHHGEYRYSSIRVNYGLDKTYDGVMTGYYTKRRQQELFSRKWYSQMLVYLYHWLKEYVEPNEGTIFKRS